MTANERRWIVLRAIEQFAPTYGFGSVPSVLILGQAELESGGFTSNLCVASNNCFGMRMPSQRATMATGSVIAEGGAAFAVFASLGDAVRDYFMRQQVFNIPNTADVDTYIDATVQSGYASDPDYGDKWAQATLALNDAGLSDPPPITTETADNGTNTVPDGGTSSKAGMGTAIVIGLALWALN